MSLLADMLSKITPPLREGHTVDAPPGLKRTVSDYTKREAIKQRIVLLSFLMALFVVSGIAAFYFAEYLKQGTGSMERGAGSGEQRSVKPVPSSQFPVPRSQPAIIEQKEVNANQPEHKQEMGLKMPEEGKGHDTIKRDKAPKVLKKEVKPAEEAADDVKAGDKDAVEKPVASKVDLYLYLAGTSENKKDYAGAIENYKNVLEIDPNNYTVLNNMANLLIYLGSFEQAIEYSKRALTIKKDHIASLINLGIAYMKIENFTEGKSYLLQALSIEPSSKYALFNTALLFEKTGDYYKANEYFRTLANIGDIQGSLGLGRIAEKEGKVAAAIKIYKDILSMGGIDPQIKMYVNERIVVLEQL